MRSCCAILFIQVLSIGFHNKYTCSGEFRAFSVLHSMVPLCFLCPPPCDKWCAKQLLTFINFHWVFPTSTVIFVNRASFSTLTTSYLREFIPSVFIVSLVRCILSNLRCKGNDYQYTILIWRYSGCTDMSILGPYNSQYFLGCDGWVTMLMLS